jgi:hypothetical protein
VTRGFARTFLVALLASSASLAQQPTTAPPPATAPSAAPSVVVVADPFDDETENAKLRARVYEVARERGLTPDSKADVQRSAETSGVLAQGKVSSDPGDLEKLRVALAASMLIRVSRDPSGIRVQLVRVGGVTEKVVASAEGVGPATAELLGGKAAPPPAAASVPVANPMGPSSAGTITASPDEEPERDLRDPKQLALAWENRGGVRFSYGVRAVLAGLMIPDVQYASGNPETGELDVGKTTTYGLGGGVGVTLSMMYLPMPDSRSEAKSWAAFRLGVGLDATGFYQRPPAGYSYKLENGVVVSKDTKYDNKAYIFGVIPFQAGVHFGFGEYRLPTLWRGLVLGIAYSPSVILWMDVDKDQDAIESRFNWAGVEVSLDIAKIEVDSGSQPQIRLSALLLPKVADDLPWYGSVGIGMVWY